MVPEENGRAVDVVSPPQFDTPSFRLRLAAGLLFAVLLSLWTWKLLESQPVPDEVKSGLAAVWKFLPLVLAKCLHAGGYATLGLLGCVWPPRRGRAAVVAFLLLHGVGTEVAQTYIPNRTGKVTDVCVDWIGILAGVVCSWRVRP